jgi:hypothetical protein
VTSLSDRNIVRLGFAQLRVWCDPRGHSLLDDLEKVCLSEIHVRELVSELRELERADAKVVELAAWSRKVPCD